MSMAEDIKSWNKCWICGKELINPTDKKMTAQRICSDSNCDSHEGGYA